MIKSIFEVNSRRVAIKFCLSSVNVTKRTIKGRSKSHVITLSVTMQSKLYLGHPMNTIQLRFCLNKSKKKMK